MHRRKFQFQFFKRDLLFLFCIFSGDDGFAQIAGMVAIERLRHRFVERFSLEIVSKHRGPGNRLQQRPVRAESSDDRKND